MNRKRLNVPFAVDVSLLALSILAVPLFGIADTLAGVPDAQAAPPVAWPRRPVSAVAAAKVVFGSIDMHSEVENQEPFEIDAPMPVPHDLPVPFMFATRRAAEAGSLPHFWAAGTPNSFPVLQDFAALDDNNTATPPDVSGAVGTNHLMIALNSEVRIQTRTGTQLARESIRSFFDPIRGTQRVYDPRVVYDARAGRWIICAIADDRTSSTAQRTNSGLLLGISDTGDPTGGWVLYRFAGDPNNVWWLDYPELGFTDNQIVITTNVYTISDSTFKEASVFLISKANPSSGDRVDVTDSGGTMTPTVSLDAGAPPYLFQTWNGNDSSGFGYMRLYSVSAAGISPIAWIQSSPQWANKGASGADFAPQLGTSNLIDAGDDRNLIAVYRNGSIWAAGTIFLPASAPTRSSVQWWQVSPSGSVIQHGLIDDPTSETFYAYPSLAVNSRSDVIIAGSQFSSSMYASSFLASRSSSDPPNTISSTSAVKNGLASYYKSFSNRNRWGDYMTSVVDPVNDTDFWTVQEYASTPLAGYDRWGTWWANVIAGGSGVQPATCVPSTTVACMLNSRFQVSVRYRGAFDNNPVDTNALLKPVTGFASSNFETAFFYFNSSNNIEMLVKILDQGNTNSQGQPTIAVLFGTATPLRIQLTITDMNSGAVKQYTSGFNAMQGVTDFTAFVK